MSTTIQSFFTSQALHLHAGRFDLLVRGYSVPLVVEMPDNEFLLLRSRVQVAHAFRLKFTALKAVGIDYLRASVTQTCPETGGRANAQVSWFYVGGSGARQGETLARYFLARQRGSLCVQMIGFEKLAFPDIADWFRVASEMPTHRSGSREH